MSRPALIAVVSACACLAGAAEAPACLLQGGSANPVGGESGTPVHPGDPMQFTVSKLDGGARYTISIDGVRLATRTKTEAGLGPAQGSFTLGSYGPSPRTLRVDVHVYHAGGGSGHEDTLNDFLGGTTLNYVPPAAARPAPEPETPAGQPTSTHAPAAAAAPVPAAPPATAPAQALRPRTARGAAPVRSNVRAARGTARFVRQRVTVQVAPAPHTTALGGRPLTTAAPVAAPSPRAAVRARSAPARTPARRAAHAPAVERTVGDDKTMPAERPLAAARANTTRRAPAAPVALLAVCLAFAALAAGGLGWAARRRRRAPGDPPDAAALAVEAELQEIIAEHRAADAARPPPTHASR